MRLDVPYLDQSKLAPTGCESVTAVMLLHYLGNPVTIDTFLDQYLEQGPYEKRNGEQWGVDPHEAFVGDPRSADALGCYAPVLVRALRRTLGGGFDVTDETGTEIEILCRRYIDRGMPVPLWASIDMKPTVKGPWYRLIPSGKPFMWVSNEHCLLLTGYDKGHYFFNDPWDDHGAVAYPWDTVWQRHREQGMQAVGVRRRT